MTKPISTLEEYEAATERVRNLADCEGRLTSSLLRVLAGQGKLRLAASRPAGDDGG